MGMAFLKRTLPYILLKMKGDAIKMKQISLHFNGPFSFSDSGTSLFHSKHNHDEGIYLWVIKDQNKNINYIHYIGETTRFSRRQREHFTNMLGLSYYVIDPDLAKQGVHKIIWNGMWRDKSNDAVNTTMEHHAALGDQIINYIKSIDVYFAPTKLSSNVRKHVEGCIGRNLRNKHPDATLFYPNDNRVGTMKDNLGQTVSISSDEVIAGLDTDIEI